MLFFTAFFDVGSIACVIEPKKTWAFRKIVVDFRQKVGRFFCFLPYFFSLEE